MGNVNKPALQAFNAAVDDAMTKRNLSRTKAKDAVMRSRPDLHRAMLLEANPNALQRPQIEHRFGAN
jgi:hypothetical protein